MQVSQRLTEFVAAEEGVVTRAYRDPVGILTIGVGHTSAAGAPKVVAGMTIMRKQAFGILRDDLRKFVARCETAMPHAAPHELEGATSFDFNTGAIHKASWVKFWAANDDKEARRRFLLWNKAGGKRLRGLAARREREADIIFLNKWPDQLPQAVGVASSTEYLDQLKKLGYLASNPVYFGKINEVVKDFQRDKGLVVDGVVGPATRATLQRAVAAKRATQASGAAGVATGGGTLPLSSINSTTALAVAAGVIVAGLLIGWAYRNRGRLFGIRAKITDGAA